MTSKKNSAMNLWVNFGLKFTLFYKRKMAKISPKINKIEIWPRLRPKVINSCTVGATVDCSQGGGDLVVDCAR